MFRQHLPGHPIHIRVAGDHVMVMFDRIPWQFRCEDVPAAVTAFSENNTAYFQDLWWERHQDLLKPSPKLALLVPHISPDELFSANRIISLGSFLGFYGSWDLLEMEQDFQRLSLLPRVCRWLEAGHGMVHLDGQEPAAAWPGHLWRAAIERAAGSEGLESGYLAEHRADAARPSMLAS